MFGEGMWVIATRGFLDLGIDSRRWKAVGTPLVASRF
jgi:hypothetical protein